MILKKIFIRRERHREINYYKLLFVCTFLFASANAAASEGNRAATVTQIKKSIVAVGTVQARRSPKNIIHGTGFVIKDGLHVITNAHVVNLRLDRKNREKRVIFIANDRGFETRSLKIVKILKEFDLALLKFEGEAITPVRIGNSESVQEGEQYFFTGYPLGAIFGLFPSTHHALLASIAPRIIPVDNSKFLNTQTINQLRQPYNIFQLDATVYPGGSGSPLYHPTTGQVIGVINMTLVKKTKEHMLSDPSGIVYAIPAQFIARLFE